MKYKKYFQLCLIALILVLSMPALAEAAPLSGLKGLLTGFKGVLNAVIPVLFALATIYFLWGVGQFILNDARNDKTRAEGKKKILWGVIALFVLFSIFGILRFISNAVGIDLNSGAGGAGGTSNCTGNELSSGWCDVTP